MNPQGLLARVYFLIRPYGLKKLSAAISISLLHALLQVVGVTSIFPFFSIASDPETFRQSSLGIILNQHWPQQSDTELLLGAGIISLLLLFLSSVLAVSAQYVRSRYSQGFAHWLRGRLIRRIAAQPYAYFLENNPAILNKKINHDVHQFSAWVLQPLLDVAAGLVAIVFLLASILWIDLRISFGALFVIGGFYLLSFSLLSSQRSKVNQSLKTAVRDANSEALNLLNGSKLIKIFGAQEHYINRFEKHSRSASQMHARLPIFIATPKHLIEPVAFGALIAYTLIIVQRGESLADVLPTLSVIALAAYRMIPTVQLVYARLSQVSAMRHTLDEVFEEFSDPEPFEKGPVQFTDPISPDNFSIENISLERLAFHYPNTEKCTLKNVNLEISSGDAIAICGASGAGKSTLIDILLALQNPTSGTFQVNGTSLSQSEKRQYQSRIGYVQQEAYLANESVRANIAFGISPESIDQARLIEACSYAQILETIEHKFEQGFDTIVGERGVKLSGGQRQRIALARALYIQPQLLILDEATSALDIETESLVTTALDSLHGSMTLIVVTHRTSTIQNIQRKYQLINGELVAQE